MPAFNYAILSEILETLTNVCKEALEKSPCYLTVDEFVEAFIRPEHVEKLRDVSDLLGNPAVTAQWKVTSPVESASPDMLRMSLTFYQQPGMFVPPYITQGFAITTPAGQKISAWAKERREHGILLGDAYDAMNWLNDACGNAKAMSLVFPALQPLMVRAGAKYPASPNGEEDRMTKRANSITNTKALGTMPVLPREVIDRIRSASALVQAFLLTDEAEALVPTNTCAAITAPPVTRTQDPTAAGSLYARPSIIPGQSTFSFI